MLHCRNGGCEYYRLEVKNPASRSDAFRAAKYTSELPEIIFQNAHYQSFVAGKSPSLPLPQGTAGSGFQLVPAGHAGA